MGAKKGKETIRVNPMRESTIRENPKRESTMRENSIRVNPLSVYSDNMYLMSCT